MRNGGLHLKRENRTEDIVRRLGVITADRVHFRRFPIKNPVTIFNPGLLVEGNLANIYARVVLGYYSYTSAIAEIRIPLEELCDLTLGNYTAEIIVYPDNRFDIYGTEDPRTYEIRGEKFMTYCGRTVAYYNPAIRTERTLPVTAVMRDGQWKKVFVFRMPESIRESVISDKDAFIVESNGDFRLFHRPHMRNDSEKFHLCISDIDDDLLTLSGRDGLQEVVLKDTVSVLEPEKFEMKLGWSTPPVRVGRELLLIVHALDSEGIAYRAFAVLMDEEMNITAVTPHYIMEPRERYEVFGDRPYVVFPCGAQIVDDRLLISYGAADFAIGVGEIDLSELMSILDSNRVL
ncbi:MAG: hypothetical protein PWR09_1034 [Archaeoglobi archaeon]|nr:hypothetical protein [Archaeoglobi archaeon]